MEWDFFQHYPYTGDDAIEDETKKEPKIKNPREGIAVSGEPQFTYDVSAEGMIEAKVWVQSSIQSVLSRRESGELSES